jgi:hypothetical protein
MKDFLSPDQIAALRVTHRSMKDKKLADRIKSMLLLNKGFSYIDGLYNISRRGKCT